MRCEYGGTPLVTSVVTMDKKKRICVFNEEIWLPIMMPVMSDRLVISFYEKKNVLKDELISTLVFSIKTLLSQSGSFYWKSLYGAPLENDNKEAALAMNSNPELASLYKGCVLLHVESF